MLISVTFELFEQNEDQYNKRLIEIYNTIIKYNCLKQRKKMSRDVQLCLNNPYI